MTSPTEDPGTSSAVARNSMSVSAWVLVSRITGFCRVAVIAAVLGPTYLGNTFQAINQLPNLIMYELLLGSLFVSLLVPSLVRHVDEGDTAGVERLAGAFLGVITLAFAIVVVLAILAGPLLLRLFVLGVEDPLAAAAQRRVGWLLLVIVMPQVLFYGIASTAAAIMNAHGRFVLPSAAPVLENLGVIATLGATAALFGTGTNLEDVPLAQLLLLGVGATAAVGLHAAAQWWGVWRLGIRLTPRAGWRDPQVRQLFRRVVPSLGYAWLSTLRGFAIVVAANRVPGGVVAFQLARQVSFMPVALGANPVAVALLPQLSRLFQARELRRFGDEFVRGINLVYFVTVPATVACLVFAERLAELVSFGEMATATGVALIAVALAALALGEIGESRFVIGVRASYACHDARSPLYSMLCAVGVTLAGTLVAFLLPPGTAVLLVLGVTVSASSLVGAWDLLRRIRRKLPAGHDQAVPAILRAVAASVLMAGPAYGTATAAAAFVEGRLAHVAELLAGGAVGLLVYVALQRWWGSPELSSLVTAMRTGSAAAVSHRTDG
jgi:putative peptidoglycan lipid II flippase